MTSLLLFSKYITDCTVICYHMYENILSGNLHTKMQMYTFYFVLFIADRNCYVIKHWLYCMFAHVLWYAVNQRWRFCFSCNVLFPMPVHFCLKLTGNLFLEFTQVCLRILIKVNSSSHTQCNLSKVRMPYENIIMPRRFINIVSVHNVTW
jgi:hypothetical protein